MMKTIALLPLLSVFIVFGTYSQETKRAPKTQAYHLQKAKRDKKVAIITGSVAAGALVGGLAFDSMDPGAGATVGEHLDYSLRAVALYITSSALAVTSIAFTVGHGVHRRKAAELAPIAYINRHQGLPPRGDGTQNQTINMGISLRF